MFRNEIVSICFLQPLNKANSIEEFSFGDLDNKG